MILTLGYTARAAMDSSFPSNNSFPSKKNQVASTATRTDFARVKDGGFANTQRQRPAAKRMISASCVDKTHGAPLPVFVHLKCLFKTRREVAGQFDGNALGPP